MKLAGSGVVGQWLAVLWIPVTFVFSHLPCIAFTSAPHIRPCQLMTMKAHVCRVVRTNAARRGVPSEPKASRSFDRT
ncbi:hypothetical protein JR316_0012949 [Psilocybe cubensis]|uniref:Uncharacterized protein n=1 Tax=Psilocybe cubensis TaxID=181762 RepID=A0ACB8GFL5_PSICU|nr:hypothetical protein JR316_0012949 [Psilocybe cubensis]KAH9474490.1 hypothetical protein JR316_0012949 [Psilocybe cubensis]